MLPSGDLDQWVGGRVIRVLIVGAGVAGPTLAYWLQRLGHKPTLVEWRLRYAVAAISWTSGVQASTWPNGWASSRS